MRVVTDEQAATIAAIAFAGPAHETENVPIAVSFLRSCQRAVGIAAGERNYLNEIAVAGCWPMGAGDGAEITPTMPIRM